jgi:hypothetical protein
MARPIASFTAIALLSASLAACDKPGVTDRQRESKAAERTVSSSSEGEQQPQGAQVPVAGDIAAVEPGLGEAREAYVQARLVDLVELDRKIIDLEANVQTAPAKTRTVLEAPLPAIRAQRNAFIRHMQALHTATAATWDGAKESLDKEWDSLQADVDGAAWYPAEP